MFLCYAVCRGKHSPSVVAIKYNHGVHHSKGQYGTADTVPSSPAKEMSQPFHIQDDRRVIKGQSLISFVPHHDNS